MGHQVDQGKEVAGLPEGGFADAAAGMGADGIEVTQPGQAPAGLTGRQVRQHLLHGSFGVSVWVDRSHRRTFRNWHRVRQAVEGGTAAEHQRPAVVTGHGLEQAAAASHVGIPVAQRFGHGFSYRLQASEMQHRLHLGCAGGFEGPVQIATGADIPLQNQQSSGLVRCAPVGRSQPFQGTKTSQDGHLLQGFR